MEPLILEFENNAYQKIPFPNSRARSSWVYIWVDEKSKLAVYVGETSQNLTKRLRYSIGELSHNTLTQLRNNAEITGYPLQSKLRVYAYPLTHSQGIPARQIKRQRRSIEAWVHWFICVRLKSHHNQYCGFKYNLPNFRDKDDAEKIIKDLANHCGWSIKSLSQLQAKGLPHATRAPTPVVDVRHIRERQYVN